MDIPSSSVAVEFISQRQQWAHCGRSGGHKRGLGWRLPITTYNNSIHEVGGFHEGIFNILSINCGSPTRFCNVVSGAATSSISTSIGSHWSPRDKNSTSLIVALHYTQSAEDKRNVFLNACFPRGHFIATVLTLFLLHWNATARVAKLFITCGYTVVSWRQDNVWDGYLLLTNCVAEERIIIWDIVGLRNLTDNKRESAGRS